MNRDYICALIITYNGENDIEKVIESLLYNDIDNIIIVDNNSIDRTKNVIKKIEIGNLILLENKKNFGIAKALNQGFEIAKSNDFNWVLTLDQDSFISKGFIEVFRQEYLSMDKKEKIGCFAPKVLSRFKDDNIFQQKYTNDIEERQTVITSGSLVNIEAYIKVEGFNNKLFIDYVDFDFSLKLTNNGYKIIRCNKAILYHSLGSLNKINCFGKEFYYTTHSSFRKYFMSRNYIYMLRTYFFSNPLWVAKMISFFVLFVFKVIFIEDKKKENLTSIIDGLKDGLLNNFENII